MTKELLKIKNQLDDNPFVPIPGIVTILNKIVTHLLEDAEAQSALDVAYSTGFYEGRHYEKKARTDTKHPNFKPADRVRNTID